MSQASAPDPSWKGLPSWLIFAFLVLGPPAALLAFARTVTQNPLLTAFLIVIYEVFVLIIRFAGKVWEHLETSLADYMSRRIALFVQDLASSYHRRYCQHLVYEHQVFDMKGLSTRTAHDLELEQVFVELSIDPTATHQATADPLHVPESLQWGEHTIWEYLISRSLVSRHLVIVGPPGSGKTTLLKHIALTLARSKKKDLHHTQLAHTLPILLFLRDHASSISGNLDFSLVDALQNHLQIKWQLTAPPDWFVQRLRKGRCLVLLDGLDEVADPLTRRQVADWVQRQILAFGQNRFVLTSRPYGYRDNPLDGVTILETHSFTAHQIEQFVQNWYLANELKSWGRDDPGARMRAQEGAQDLLDRLRHYPALRSLAVNPLLLTMIATVHRYRASLPGKRVALYSEICEVFLGKRQEVHGIAQELSAAQKQQVLQPLAYHLMLKGKREIEASKIEEVIASHIALVSTQLQPKVFLDMVQNTSGLFLEQNPGIYSFAHLTFQEYLAAVYIKEENFEQVLIEQVGNTWWHETIRLYCAQADATALIAACLTRKSPSVEARELALECQQEALKIQQSVRYELDTLLAEGVESPNRELRRVVAEAFLAQRLQQMVHLHEEIYIDTSLITHAEYQLFLDEQSAFGKSYQPDHWSRGIFPSGTGPSPAVGVRWADAHAFCHWLTARSSGLWHYRLPKEIEMERIENREKLTVKLAEDTGCWTEDRRCSIRNLPLSSGKQLSLFLDLLARDLAHGRAHDLTLARDFALRVDGDLAHVRARTIASNRTDDFIRARDFADSLERNLAFTLVLDRALDNVGAGDFVDDLHGGLDGNLALANALDYDLLLARASTLASSVNFSPAFASIGDFDLVFVDGFSPARALAYASARNFARASFARASARNFDLAHTIAFDLATALENDLITINALIQYFNRIQEKEMISRLFWYIRYSAYVLANYFRYCIRLTYSQNLRLPKSVVNQRAVYESSFESYLDICIAFALLEGRMQRRLPAWEGILLVKEPVKDS
jgi:energy-coupling factor transporter ATP-binding protein EcfA2